MQLLRQKHRNTRTQSGAALVIAVLFMLVLGGMAASLAVLNVTFHKEHTAAREQTKAFYAAEAGLNEALAVLLEQGEAQVQALAYPRNVGPSTYTVDVAFGDQAADVRADRVRLRSVGDSGVLPVGVELMLERVPNSDFGWALLGDERVLLETGCMVDSYDSNDGDYPVAVTYANTAGNVASNDDIVFQTNAEVYGDVTAGPAGTIDDSATGVLIVGETDTADVLVGFPVVVVPSFASLGALSVTSTTTTLTGDLHYSDIDVDGGTLVIEGPARVVVDTLDVNSTSELRIDATNGAVEIYGTGRFYLQENSDIMVTTPQPREVGLYLTGSNLNGGTDTIILDSDGDFLGTIYAPDALVDVDNEFHVYGAVKAKRIQLEFDGEVHFDEDLLYDTGADPVYAQASWRRLSAAEVRALGI